MSAKKFYYSLAKILKQVEKPIIIKVARKYLENPSDPQKVWKEAKEYFK